MKRQKRSLQKGSTANSYIHADVADAMATTETAADAKEVTAAKVMTATAVAAVINISRQDVASACIRVCDPPGFL